MFGHYGHLLLNNKSQVNHLPVYYGFETIPLWVMNDGLILRGQNIAVDELGPVPSGNVNIFVLDGRSYLDPPRSGI